MPGPASQSIAAQVAHHVQLDSAPMGRRQYGIWLLASGGTLLDGLSIFLLGVAMPLITSRFALGPLMVGQLGEVSADEPPLARGRSTPRTVPAAHGRYAGPA